MSQLITLDVQDGIVMVADSRTTYCEKYPFYSDSSNKLFVTNSHVGISTCGDATINDRRIQLFIEEFIKENHDLNAVDASRSLLAYFKELKGDLDTIFHVAGYVDGEPKVLRVFTKEGTITNCEHKNCGLIWNGDNYVIGRLLNKFFSMKDDQTPGNKITYRHVPWETFLIQDAIDFAVFAMNTAMSMQRFHKEKQTIGGPIDILVIKKDSSTWYAHK